MGSGELVRLPELAGSWYPAEANAVRARLEQFVALAHGVDATRGPALGGIVPHAGWTFSGRVAFDVIHAIAEGGEAPQVIAIFGKHMGPRSRPTLMRRGAWRTPLGDLPIAEELADAVFDQFDFAEETADRYESDNTIELQLPFIKGLFPDTTILPVGAPARAESVEIGQSVARAAQRLGLSLRVIGSTDLTHYGPNYRFVPKGVGPDAERWVREQNDRTIVEQLVAMDAEQVLRHAEQSRSACCSGAAVAALAAAHALGATAGTLLDYATSNDVRPGGQSFVGYAGIVYH